jgi:hypothetical protein
MQADVEQFLARLLVDPQLRDRFLLDPMTIAAEHCLSPVECGALGTIDAHELCTAARSFTAKRRRTSRGDAIRQVADAVQRWLRRRGW